MLHQWCVGVEQYPTELLLRHRTPRLRPCGTPCEEDLSEVTFGVVDGCGKWLVVDGVLSPERRHRTVFHLPREHVVGAHWCRAVDDVDVREALGPAVEDQRFCPA